MSQYFVTASLNGKEKKCLDELLEFYPRDEVRTRSHLVRKLIVEQHKQLWPYHELHEEIDPITKRAK